MYVALVEAAVIRGFHRYKFHSYQLSLHRDLNGTDFINRVGFSAQRCKVVTYFSHSVFSDKQHLRTVETFIPFDQWEIHILTATDSERQTAGTCTRLLITELPFLYPIKQNLKWQHIQKPYSNIATSVTRNISTLQQYCRKLLCRTDRFTQIDFAVDKIYL